MMQVPGADSWLVLMYCKFRCEVCVWLVAVVGRREEQGGKRARASEEERARKRNKRKVNATNKHALSLQAPTTTGGERRRVIDLIHVTYACKDTVSAKTTRGQKEVSKGPLASTFLLSSTLDTTFITPITHTFLILLFIFFFFTLSPFPPLSFS